jgi:formiminotetrahydrofolate cyclodeaminase
VAARCLDTAVFGAVCNVRVNLSQITDSVYVTKMEEEAANAVKTSTSECQAVLAILESKTEE